MDPQLTELYRINPEFLKQLSEVDIKALVYEPVGPSSACYYECFSVGPVRFFLFHKFPWVERWIWAPFFKWKYDRYRRNLHRANQFIVASALQRMEHGKTIY